VEALGDGEERRRPPWIDLGFVGWQRRGRSINGMEKCWVRFGRCWATSPIGFRLGPKTKFVWPNPAREFISLTLLLPT
jgi:hypothetical protein